MRLVKIGKEYVDIGQWGNADRDILRWTSSTSDVVADLHLLQQYLQRPSESVINIHRIGDFNLFHPLCVLIENDDDGFLARTPDIPQLYGFGETIHEAIEMLQREIHSLYDDLIEGGEFTGEWISVKKFLERLFRG